MARDKREEMAAEVEALKAEVHRLTKVNRALMGRVERSTASELNSFTLFEGNVLLSSRVRERTRELETLTQVLQAERHKLDLLIRSLPGRIVIFNRNFKVIDLYTGKGVNIEINRRMGLSEQLGPEFESRFNELEARVSSGDVTENFDFLRNDQGQEKFLNCSLSMMEPGIFLLTLLDVTEQMKVERLVQEQQAQIIQSSKFAALGEMAGGIAHEINNPLAIIGGLASQLKMQVEDQRIDLESVLRVANKIEATVDRISKIVKGLRQLSREGSQDSFQNASLSSIVTDVLDLSRETLKAKEIELRLNIDFDRTVYVNRIQLSQVLVNLLTNSVYAVSRLPNKSGKWVEIKTEADDNFIVLLVRDGGTGINEKTVAKIFQPFYTTKEVGEGTGLGLSISKQIMENHKGSIDYELRDGHTTFCIKLPIVSEVTAL